jgi:hypothetical protein
VVRDCQRSRLEDAYRTYLNNATAVVTDSAEQGKALQTALNNQRGRTPPQLQTDVRGIAGGAQDLVRRAQDLDPPEALAVSNQSLVTALQYRVTGLRALADVLPQVISSRDNAFASATIAQRMQRFLASDVIYQDSFVGPAKRALADEDVTGIEVPETELFLPGATANFAAPAGAATLLPRLRRSGGAAGGRTGGGNLRGTGLISTVAEPENKELVPGTTTTLKASDQLKWKVTVRNQGDFVENGVVVRATFSNSANPEQAQTVEGEIDTIAPGEEKPVTLDGPTNPSFDQAASLKIEVVPVPDEGRTDNNRAEYPVRITF